MKIPTESYFNIALETLSYFGPNEYPERCFYGGIAVYIIEGLKVIEALTACWNISSKHVDILNGSSPTYNIITTHHTTSVIIVAYGYSIYSTIHTIINISETNCLGIYVRIEPCKAPRNVYFELYFVANINIKSQKSLHNIYCKNRDPVTISIPREACLSFVISQMFPKAFTSRTCSKYIGLKMQYFFEDRWPTFETNAVTNYVKVWNVETYGSNIQIKSDQHIEYRYIKDFFLYENILRDSNPYFSYDPLNVEFCSSVKHPRCNKTSKNSRLEGNNKSLMRLVHSKVTRLSKKKYIAYYDPLNDEIPQLVETLYIYPCNTLMNIEQYWTFMKIYFIFCNIPVWKTYVPSDSLLRDLILSHCQNDRWSLRTKNIAKHGFSLYTEERKYYEEKSVFARSYLDSYYDNLAEYIHRNIRHYYQIYILSKVSYLPDTVGKYHYVTKVAILGKIVKKIYVFSKSY